MLNNDALIGYTGFVGSNLLEQRSFAASFNSSNISSIRGRDFDHVICAGVTAVKWWANKNAQEDRSRIQGLMDNLATITASRFTLISTIDVYGNPSNVRETDKPDEVGLHAYGLNRAMLEEFVATRFVAHHIVRLPGLFGKGLKKNAIYDMMNGNMLEVINPESTFQWYSLDRLSSDIDITVNNDIHVVNFAPEPVKTKDIQERFFPDVLIGSQAGPAAHYRMLSIYADAFGGIGDFIMSKEAVFDSLGKFIGAPAP